MENKLNYLITGGIALGVFALFAFNIVNNNKFLEASFTSILSLASVIFISYYLVQRKNKERRIMDNIDIIINKVQVQLNSTQLIDSSTKEAQKKSLMYQKSLASKMLYIKQNCPVKFKKEVEYICIEFERLRDLYGEHMEDNVHIKKSSNDFKRIITNIDDKCDALHLQLYKF